MRLVMVIAMLAWPIVAHADMHSLMRQEEAIAEVLKGLLTDTDLSPRQQFERRIQQFEAEDRRAARQQAALSSGDPTAIAAALAPLLDRFEQARLDLASAQRQARQANDRLAAAQSAFVQREVELNSALRRIRGEAQPE